MLCMTEMQLGTVVASGGPGTERGLFASIAGVGAVGGRVRGTRANSLLGIRPLLGHQRTGEDAQL